MDQAGLAWTPRTEAELQAAIDDGLTESHYLDFKRELPHTDSANKNLAIDIASLAVDGGTLIIGVDDATSPPSLTPIDLNNLAERVTQIALTRPDEGVPVRTFSIPSASQPERGYLVIQVPASPRAPHMVNGRYYGRADKTNRVLSNAEVVRLHALQHAAQRDILADARNYLHDLLGTSDPPPMLLLLAEPTGKHNDPLVALTEPHSFQQPVRALIKAAAIPEHQEFWPSLRPTATRIVRRAGAVAATTELHNGKPFPGDEHTAELRLYESGEILLASRRAVVFPDSVDEPRAFEPLIKSGRFWLLPAVSGYVS